MKESSDGAAGAFSKRGTRMIALRSVTAWVEKVVVLTAWYNKAREDALLKSGSLGRCW